MKLKLRPIDIIGGINLDYHLLLLLSGMNELLLISLAGTKRITGCVGGGRELCRRVYNLYMRCRRVLRWQVSPNTDTSLAVILLELSVLVNTIARS